MQSDFSNIKSIRRYIYSNNFGYFLEKVFYHINPNIDYHHNWHLDYISAKLENLYTNKNNRLIINLPPRNLKSICISIAWPTWLLGQDSSYKIICASYSQILSDKHVSMCRDIISSKWYQEIFSHTKLKSGNNTKSFFYTTQNGFMFSASTRSTLTGIGGDYLILDDPQNPSMIYSQKYTERLYQWFSQVFMTRLNDKKTGKIIIVMQRLSQSDLCGYIENKDKSSWDWIKLPALSTKDTKYYYQDNCYLHKKGKVLNEQHENLKIIQQIKTDIGEHNFNAQYQQKPLSISKGIIKKSHINYFDLDLSDILKKNDIIICSWDTAFKTSENSDYSACTVWRIYDNKYYLIYAFQDKLIYPDLKAKTLEVIKNFSCNIALIEDKASGQNLIQDLENNSYRCHIHPIKINQNKLYRLINCLPFFEEKSVFFAKNQDWLSDLENELFSYPNSKHDDQIDSISQFFNYVTKIYSQSKIKVSRMQIRTLK